MALQTNVPVTDKEATRTYAAFEERVMARDQVGASDIFYDLVRQRRPLTEMIGETVRIHAPYTTPPYHQRLDDGVARFVNNDHCLLSARVSLRLPGYIPEELRFLPMAQTVWYVPTGLDAWNQLLNKAPGHYNRRRFEPDADDPVGRAVLGAVVHWEDQEPLHLDGTYEEGLNHWLTLVMRGEVVEAYRVFLGLMEDEVNRPRALAQLVFAGLIDVQDRVLKNLSYTTGHKAYRARATVELGEAIGWENAHAILYAGVPDIAVGPRWHSAYEMACQVSMRDLAEEQPASTLSPTAVQHPEARLLSNELPLSDDEVETLVRILLTEHEPGYIDEISRLLLAGRSGRSIVDALQIAGARLLLRTSMPRGFAIPQHVVEYMNTLAWFFDTFDHKHRLKLLYVAGSFINSLAMSRIAIPEAEAPPDTSPPRGAHALSSNELLRNIDESIAALDPAQSVAWTRGYLEGGYDRGPLIETLAVSAVKLGNDPHNQELGLAPLEDYLKNKTAAREELILAAVQHTAGHMKYGDPTEAYSRFAGAFDITTNGVETQGSAEPEEQLLDG